MNKLFPHNKRLFTYSMEIINSYSVKIIRHFLQCAKCVSIDTSLSQKCSVVQRVALDIYCKVHHEVRRSEPLISLTVYSSKALNSTLTLRLRSIMKL